MQVIIKVTYAIVDAAAYLPEALGIDQKGGFYLDAFGELTMKASEAKVFDSFSAAAEEVEGIEMCGGAEFDIKSISFELLGDALASRYSEGVRSLRR